MAIGQIEIHDNFPVLTPIVQRFESAKFGSYVVKLDALQPMTFSEFQEATKNQNLSEVNDPENQFWENVKKPLKEQIAPIYGIDNNISFFSDHIERPQKTNH